jgi:hypothetical protein
MKAAFLPRAITSVAEKYGALGAMSNIFEKERIATLDANIQILKFTFKQFPDWVQWFVLVSDHRMHACLTAWNK